MMSSLLRAGLRPSRLATASHLTAVTARPFAAQKNRSHSGLAPLEFDYYFESKIDHGKFPHNFSSWMKILGQDYDTQSEQHLSNLEQMNALNIELMENVDSAMAISPQQEAKLKKTQKNDARQRIRMLLDRGSPFLPVG